MEADLEDTVSENGDDVWAAPGPVVSARIEHRVEGHRILLPAFTIHFML